MIMTAMTTGFILFFMPMLLEESFIRQLTCNRDVTTKHADIINQDKEKENLASNLRLPS